MRHEQEEKTNWSQHGRCWDGKFGCEQMKLLDEFKWHNRLCQSCCALYAARYGAAASDIQILMLLLWEESSMVQRCLSLGMEKAKADVLNKSGEQRIRMLYPMLITVWMKKNARDEVARVMEMYRREVYTLAGIQPPKVENDMVKNI